MGNESGGSYRTWSVAGWVLTRMHRAGTGNGLCLYFCSLRKVVMLKMPFKPSPPTVGLKDIFCTVSWLKPDREKYKALCHKSILYNHSKFWVANRREYRILKNFRIGTGHLRPGLVLIRDHPNGCIKGSSTSHSAALVFVCYWVLNFSHGMVMEHWCQTSARVLSMLSTWHNATWNNREYYLEASYRAGNNF